jgi:hypothetical protein
MRLGSCAGPACSSLGSRLVTATVSAVLAVTGAHTPDSRAPAGLPGAVVGAAVVGVAAALAFAFIADATIGITGAPFITTALWSALPVAGAAITAVLIHRLQATAQPAAVVPRYPVIAAGLAAIGMAAAQAAFAGQIGLGQEEIVWPLLQ